MKNSCAKHTHKAACTMIVAFMGVQAMVPCIVSAQEPMMPFDEYTSEIELDEPGGSESTPKNWGMEEDVEHEAVDADIPEGAVDNRRKSDTELDGIDVSNWQKGIDLRSIEADFIICKATGGNGFKDKSFDDFAKTVLDRGLLFGFYHYANDGSYKGTPEEEAAWFYQNTKEYIGKGIPILDYEDPDLLKTGTDWAVRFVAAYYALTGVRCMIYTSSYVSRNLDWSIIAKQGYPLWIANYGKNPELNGYAKKTWTDAYGTGAFEEYYMHQYSSRGKLPGYEGNLDLNKFFGTKQDWMDLCKASPVEDQMHRLYNPNSGEHFYTADSKESSTLVSLGWNYEGKAWNYVSSGDPVYRLYNPNAGDHHYTLSAYEKDELVKKGWTYEGVGWYSDPKQGQPVYRAYNPNAQTGAHHFTVSQGEWRYLGENGWQLEDIAWYGVWPAAEDTEEDPDTKDPDDRTDDSEDSDDASGAQPSLPSKPAAPDGSEEKNSAAFVRDDEPVFDFVRRLTEKYGEQTENRDEK